METIESAKEIIDFSIKNLDEKIWTSNFEIKLGDSSKNLSVDVSQLYCYLPNKPQLKICLRSRGSYPSLFAAITLVGDVQVLDGDLVERLSLNTELTKGTDIYLDLVPKPGVIWDSRYNKLEVKEVKFSLEVEIDDIRHHY